MEADDENLTAHLVTRYKTACRISNSMAVAGENAKKHAWSLAVVSFMIAAAFADRIDIHPVVLASVTAGTVGFVFSGFAMALSGLGHILQVATDHAVNGSLFLEEHHKVELLKYRPRAKNSIR